MFLLRSVNKSSNVHRCFSTADLWVVVFIRSLIFLSVFGDISACYM